MLRGECLLLEEYPSVEPQEVSELLGEAAEQRRQFAEDLLEIVHEAQAASQDYLVQLLAAVEVEQIQRNHEGVQEHHRQVREKIRLGHHLLRCRSLGENYHERMVYLMVDLTADELGCAEVHSFRRFQYFHPSRHAYHRLPRLGRELVDEDLFWVATPCLF